VNEAIGHLPLALLAGLAACGIGLAVSAAAPLRRAVGLLLFGLALAGFVAAFGAASGLGDRLAPIALGLAFSASGLAAALAVRLREVYGAGDGDSDGRDAGQGA